MDNIVAMQPKSLHFPIGKVFHVNDQFNGHQRGTYWYRTEQGSLRGPFHDEAAANFYMNREANDDCA